MPKAEIPQPERKAITDQLKQYFLTNFDLHLGQFEVEFLLDFIEKICGPALYNNGIDEAIKTYAIYSERVQEEMELKRII